MKIDEKWDEEIFPLSLALEAELKSIELPI